MNKTNVTVASIKDTSKLVRARFTQGQILQHEDLALLNEYTRELSRLLFRSFFGCGVICGLVVKAEVDNCNKVSVTVGAGLALDCSGDPVHVPKDQSFALDENCYPDLPDKLWVVLCGRTKNCAPRTSMCSTDDDDPISVFTRERDMFEIKVLAERPACACGCEEPNGPPPAAMDRHQNHQRGGENCLCADPACHADHYAGTCGCHCGDCDCDCILLARLDKVDSDGEPKWTTDYRVRRFIRPVLMRDPQVELQSQNTERIMSEYKINLASTQEELKVALNEVAVAAEAVGEATALAMLTADFHAQKSAESKEVEDELMAAIAAADEARTTADRLKSAAAKATESVDKAKTKAATEKAAAEKDAADKAAEEAAVLAEEAEAEAERLRTLANEVAAEAHRAAAEASAREYARRKAIEDKVAKDQAVAAATARFTALANG